MKTAIQELISDLESKYPSLLNTHTNEGRENINAWHTFLEKEKQQIIDAFVAGDNSCCTSEENSEYYANHYFNETYNTK